MAEFIKGIALCEAFFHDIVQPILSEYAPDLRYTCGLIGYGSDVLGYDDIVSTDHMWGPRFYLFLEREDMAIENALREAFATRFPYEYRGYSVHFSDPDPNDNGVRRAQFIAEGRVSPMMWILTIGAFCREYLGGLPRRPLDWLSASEHRLLGFTAGKLFRDDLNMQRLRDDFAYYPHDVRLYLIASQWALIGEEQAFVKRCADCGDDIGSRIVSARIVERLMRLCFLYVGQYAPYSKWFGTAFSRLPIDEEVKDVLLGALAASDIGERERCLVRGQERVAHMHNESGLTEPIDVQVQNYFGRNIQVLFVDRIARTIHAHIGDATLRALPLIGTMGQVGNLVALSDDPSNAEALRGLYREIRVQG